MTRGEAPIGRAAILPGFACLAVAYLAWGWAGQITDFGGDSAAYMLQARLLSPFTSASDALREAVSNTPFPPLFPLLIALCGASFLAGHLIVIGALLGAMACLWWWLRDEGLGELAAAAVTLVFALMPGTYFQALNIMSENPYLLLSLLCIILERRAEQRGRDGSTALWWAVVATVATATLVRTAALPLLAALMIRLLMLRPRRWWLMLAGASLPLVIWLAWSAHAGTGIAVYAVQAGPVHAAGLWTRLLAQLDAELKGLLIGWLESWMGEGRVPALAALTFLIAAVCLAGWLRRLATLRFDAIYVALYLAVLLVWPFPDAAQRLSYVIVPVLLAQGALLLRALASAWPGVWGRLEAAGIAVCGLLLLPTLLLTANRFLAPVPAGAELIRHTQGWYRPLDSRNGVLSAQFLVKVVADLPGLGERVPEGACVFSEKPTIVSLYSGRMSYFPPPTAISDTEFQQQIGRCRYAYVLALTSPSFPVPYYPAARLGDSAKALSTLMADSGVYPFAQLLRIGD